MTLQQVIALFSNGIAVAEGFYVAGSRSQRNHNPGDLTVDTIGAGVGRDGQFIIYATDADGWAALHKQVELIVTDASHIYNSNMTLREIGQLYTTTDQLAWAENVARVMGIDIDTPISTLVTEVATSIGIGVIIVGVILWLVMKKGKN